VIVVVADTSGLLAAVDETHPDGLAARHALDTAGTLVVSPVLLSELDHVGRRVLGREAAHSVIDDVVRRVDEGRAVLPAVTSGILATAQDVRSRYWDLRLDLTDAVNVAFAARFRTDTMLTLDRRDFRTVQPLTQHKAFRLLPDDS
jgi:predicted nucleic acid-binding protein